MEIRAYDERVEIKDAQNADYNHDFPLNQYRTYYAGGNSSVQIIDDGSGRVALEITKVSEVTLIEDNRTGGPGAIVLPTTLTDLITTIKPFFFRRIVSSGDLALKQDIAGVTVTGLELYDADPTGKAGWGDRAQPDKKYVDDQIIIALTGNLNYQGAYDAATNTPNLDSSPTPGSILKGYFYTVTVSGTFYTETVDVGDALIAEVDDPASLADWTRVEANNQYTLSKVLSLGNTTGSNPIVFDSAGVSFGKIISDNLNSAGIIGNYAAGANSMYLSNDGSTLASNFIGIESNGSFDGIFAQSNNALFIGRKSGTGFGPWNIEIPMGKDYFFVIDTISGFAHNFLVTKEAFTTGNNNTGVSSLSGRNIVTNGGTYVNSAYVAGNGGTVNKSNFLFTDNIEIQGGIGLYTVDPTTNGSWGARAIPDKAYVDSVVVGALVYQGGYNAATNTPDLDTSPSGVLQGHTYTVTADGTFFTENVTVGDVLIAETNNPATLADWTVVERNLNQATETSPGIAPISTQVQTDAGSDDTTIVTPLKLANYPAISGNALSAPVTVIDDTDSPYAASWGEDIEINAAGNNVTVNLPTAVSNNGRTINVTRTDASTNTITLDGNATETINGSATRLLVGQWTSEILKSNNTNVTVR